MRQRRQLLLRYRDELERADEQLQGREAEEVERATEQWDAGVVARLGETDARVLGDVVAALRRLDDGTYGRCLTCNEHIAEPRLEALPTAKLCIECANEARPAPRLPVRDAHQVRRGI
jgi:RNA polymerase-binding protein DksA